MLTFLQQLQASSHTNSSCLRLEDMGLFMAKFSWVYVLQQSLIATTYNLPQLTTHTLKVKTCGSSPLSWRLAAASHQTEQANSNPNLGHNVCRLHR